MPIKNIYSNLVSAYGKKRVYGGLLVVGAILFLIVTQLGGNVAPESALQATVPEVTVASVSALNGNLGTIETLGVIEAIREARLETERGGRVTSVPVKLGDRVYAGAVIATIESSSERAAVLQAQGAYEAARASASASDVGSAAADREYTEAVTQATNAYKGAFASADNVLRNIVDQVYSQPDTTLPGLKISTGGTATELAKERVGLERLFDAWAIKTNTELSANGEALLIEAESNVSRLASLITTLTTLLSENDARSEERRTELDALRSDFADARSTVNGVLQSLSGARSALIAAKSAQDQAEIAATNGDVSLAEAQVKQALGALRVVQAQLEKTIVRSPITGTVNSLTLKEGTTITPGTPAAIISSTGGLEIVAYVNESEARRISIGTEATLEGRGMGVVTQIASALDPVTKKIEVRIGLTDESNEFTNGESVRVSIKTQSDTPTTSVEVRLPVVAIKMTPEGPVVFTVDEAGTLVAHPVKLGAIMGDSVVISEGVPTDQLLVTDARGLRAGEVVTVK